MTGFRSPTVAVVEDVHGKQSLIIGSDPLATREDGRLRRLDLSLEPDADGFTPAREASELMIPNVVGEYLRVGGDVGVRPADARSVAGKESEDRVFYAEIATDTDYVAAPTRSGAQVMWQLHSPQAPQRLGLDLDLPAGATVRVVSPATSLAGQPGIGDAEVVGADGIVLSTISAPVALDAGGTEVPAAFAFDEDGQLVVDVDHRGRDLQYPVMIDPEVRDVWGALEFSGSCGGGATGFQAGLWGYQAVSGVFTPICGEEWAGSGKGLYIRSEGWYYDNQNAAQWLWSAPNGAYIVSAWFDGLRHSNSSTHLYTGLYGANGWGSVANNYDADLAWGSYSHTPNSPYNSWTAVIGLYMDGSGTRTAWGWAGVRGVNIRLGDLDRPNVTLHSVNTGLDTTQNPQVARWVDDSQTPIVVSADAIDVGLGLQDVGVERQGGGWYGGPHHGCLGHRASPCPRSWSPSFQLNPLPEGRNSIHTWARDIVDNVAIGADWIQRIDRTGPQIRLSGELLEHASDGLLSLFPQLYVHVTDGDASSAATRRSGVKRVRVLLDGVVQQDNVNPATECDSCTLGQTWVVDNDDLGDPSYITVEAWDYLGHRSVTGFSTCVDCDGTLGGPCRPARAGLVHRLCRRRGSDVRHGRVGPGTGS